jgi:hypothetical protein
MTQIAKAIYQKNNINEINEHRPSPALSKLITHMFSMVLANS